MTSMTTSLHVSRHASESRPDLQGQQLPMDQTYSDFNDSVLDDKNFHADIGKDSEVLDIDVRFSDMSDIPPEPEQTRPKAAVGIDPQPKQQTMLNLVYRPESAGNDNCVVFNIMPSNCKLMKRPDCGNTRTNNGFVPVVASTADDDQVIRSCEIRSCEENPYQGYVLYSKYCSLLILCTDCVEQGRPRSRNLDCAPATVYYQRVSLSRT